MLQAVNSLHLYTNELFINTENSETYISKNILPDRASFKANWQKKIKTIFKQAFITYPNNNDELLGGRVGLHGEELGHLLASMQSVHRLHPGAQW